MRVQNFSALRAMAMVLVLATGLGGCKKDEDGSDSPPASGTTAEYYLQPAGSTDGVLAKINTPEHNSTTYLYGSSDQDGKPYNLSSAIVDRSGNDTLVHVIFDELVRPKLTYCSLKSGDKLGILIKFDYLPNDTIQTAYYAYDWSTHRDSLLCQYRAYGNTYVPAYGFKVTNDGNFRSFAIGIVTTAIATIFATVFIPVAAGIVVAAVVGGTTGAVLGAFTTLGVALTHVSSANASTQPPVVTPPPSVWTSPTAGVVPQPTGTPANPVEQDPIIGKWNEWQTIIAGTAYNFASYREFRSDGTIARSTNGITFWLTNELWYRSGNTLNIIIDTDVTENSILEFTSASLVLLDSRIHYVRYYKRY